MDTTDPIESNPDFYHVVFENEFVRVLEYADLPGQGTTPHTHPNSVMVTLSAFQRRLTVGDLTRDVSLETGRAVWLPAQQHSGENIGDSPTHTIFVELKGAVAGSPGEGVVGPD